MTDSTHSDEASENTQGSSIDKLEQVFLQVTEVPEDQQNALLEQLCPDVSLRQQVRELLDADSMEHQFLDHSLLPEQITIQAGESIDGYKLLRELAQGGMGVVFMAEQLEPVRRKVALKVVKPGVDTRQVIARFDAERQALSMMDHPNIAKVLDAGTTETGRPYFVMELVNGVPITSYCEQHQLSAQECLELFSSVCHAIQHAHQKGIIHRDIKPSNVLVAEYDGRPIAKVIDFGIAKAINQPLTKMTVNTGFGQIIGTFEYMSPEQSRVDQQDVDTRSDIYSLGVLLYELLTGSLPFDQERLRSAAWDEMLRIIREEDPPRPSTRLAKTNHSRLGSKRGPDEPAKFARMVRGELDWIVMKAIEKDRNRRYETPNDLANDIACFLRGDAVSACPPSATYRFRKFARRNKVVIATSAVVTASLVVGLIGTSRQAIRASLAESAAAANQRAAEASAAESRAINYYLINDLLDPFGAQSQLTVGLRPDPNLKLETLLDRALSRVEQRFAGQPELEAKLKATLASSFNTIGRYDTASRLYEEILKYQQQQGHGRQLDTLVFMRRLARIYLSQSQLVKAENLCVEALRISRDELGREHDVTLLLRNDLAILRRERRQFGEAERIHLECLEIKDRQLKQNQPDTLNIMSDLALLYEEMNRFDDAEKLHANVLEAHEKEISPDPLSIADSLNNLGRCRLKRGRHLEDRQQLEAAVPLLQKSLAIYRRNQWNEHPNTFVIKGYLAHAYGELGRYEDAEQKLVDLLKSFEEAPGKDLGPQLEAMSMLGWVYLKQNRLAEAENILNEALDQRKSSNLSDSWSVQASANLSIIRRLMGKVPESISLDEQTLKLAQAELGQNHVETLKIKARLGLSYLDAGLAEDGLVLLEEAFNAGQDLPGVFLIAGTLAESYRSEGDFETALQWTQRQIASGRSQLGNDPVQLARLLDVCGSRMLKTRNWAVAENCLQESLAIRQTAADSWRTCDTQSMLGDALCGQQKYSEAEPILTSAYENLKQLSAQADSIPVEVEPVLIKTLERLITLYDALGKTGEAANLRNEKANLIQAN